MKKPLSLLALCLSSLLSFAQFSINGKVVDADTKEPLQGASVYAQNTTKGTVTDKEGKFHLGLDKGGYEIVFSFTGYSSKTLKVQDDNSELNIELSKANNSMSEVIIQSTNEVENGWEKYGDFFLKHFIGTTNFSYSCVLQNPQALKFLYFKRSDRLKVLASEPLQIANKSLGYNLHYDLDSFVYYFKTDMSSYRGQCLYSEMDGSPEQQQVWKQNRKDAYYGSRLHFLRSYYDSTLQQEGFIIGLQSKKWKNLFDPIPNPYDSAYYNYSDSTDDAEVYFPVKASITYTKKLPDKKFLEQYKLPLTAKEQITYVDLREPIIIKPNGYFFDQKSWINQGYWSWKNLADQLPYDYDPDK